MISGNDELGHYRLCLECGQAGRYHVHTAAVLSFGPLKEPAADRCPFCRAAAEGIRVVIQRGAISSIVSVDGRRRGVIWRADWSEPPVWSARYFPLGGSIVNLGQFGSELEAEAAIRDHAGAFAEKAIVWPPEDRAG